MEKLEVKAQTVLTGRVTPITASTKDPAIKCAVDGCQRTATVTCEVKVTNSQLAPTSETHLINFCDTHSKAFDTLKWGWRRAADKGASPQLTLDGVYASDTAELS